MKGIEIMEKKLTKKEILMAIKNHVATMTEVDGIPTDVVIEYVDTTIAQIDAKAAKAKEKAAEKKADGDALREEVFALVTNEWQTADAITTALGKEDISKLDILFLSVSIQVFEGILNHNTFAQEEATHVQRKEGQRRYHLGWRQ